MRKHGVYVVALAAALLTGFASAPARAFNCGNLAGASFVVLPDGSTDVDVNLGSATAVLFEIRSQNSQDARIRLGVVGQFGQVNIFADREIERGQTLFITFQVPLGGDRDFLFRLMQEGGGSGRSLVELTCLTGIPPHADAKTAIAQGVGTYLNNRARLLLSSDPDRSRIARRLAGAEPAGARSNKAELSLGENGYSASAMLSPRSAGLRVWSEGYFADFQEHISPTLSNQGNFEVVYAGGDVLLGPNVMLGMLVQFDWLKEEELFGGVDGEGWMAGPYIGILLGRNWEFDARAAWGRSDNDLGIVGSFDGDRWLARASLRGNWYSGQWRFTSITELGYVEESQERFHALGALAVPDQSVSLGRFTFGPELAYRIEGNGRFFEPQVSLQGLWNFAADGEIDADGLVWEPAEFYGRVEGGLMFGRTGGGMTFRAIGAYEGIGTSDFDVWSGRVWASIPLN
jgi:hypothetical protein